MRDLFFITFFLVMLPIALRKPFVSVSIWLWSGLFVPIYWLYGFAESIPYNVIFAAVTVLSYLASRNRPEFKLDSLFLFISLFFLHTTLTTFTTIVNPDITWIAWENFFKVFLLFVFICLIVREKVHFELMIWVLVLSVGFYALVEGLKFVATGGGHNIHGPRGHLMADNNHLALAILMVIPLIAYLICETSDKWLRVGLIGILGICVFAVLGTKSRGGFLGLLVVSAYFWSKSNRKMLSAALITLVCIVAASLVSDRWLSRMDTIKTAKEDSSFMARVVSWKIHTLMAIERPLLGGGFKAPQHGHIWRALALDIDKLDAIPTPPPENKSWAAHSIYFQVLGDHGFVGLFLFLLVICLAFLKLSSIEKYFGQSWQSKLAKMMKVSLVAYCVAGAALSMAYFELFYALLAMIACLFVAKQEHQTRALCTLNHAKTIRSAQSNTTPKVIHIHSLNREFNLERASFKRAK
ncbi:putative O-glycosylation ligase, exosortase A system-associated [Vibrio alfacsensis]|uniref:putative O-glycosylation ligase, exosortase A system-associated n=1 Tax=Vibrio alfacsensis TaxID=1074311 RepID=UPI004067E18F